MRRGGYKCKTQKKHLQSSFQQLKTFLYKYRLLYQNFRVTANQKSTIDTHTNKKKQSKHNTKETHQTREEEKKKQKQIHNNE